MPEINWDSILEKAQACVAKPENQKKIEKLKDNYILNNKSGGRSFYGQHTPVEAGEAFGRVLRATIQSSDLPSGVISLLEDYDVSKAYKISNGKYMVFVSFNKDTLRESMSTFKSYYNVDIAELYNNGVDHIMPQIWERTPDGKLEISNNYIPGAHFMEQAVVDFFGNFGSEYDVLEIVIEGDDINSLRGKERSESWMAYKDRYK